MLILNNKIFTQYSVFVIYHSIKKQRENVTIVCANRMTSQTIECKTLVLLICSSLWSTNPKMNTQKKNESHIVFPSESLICGGGGNCLLLNPALCIWFHNVNKNGTLVVQFQKTSIVTKFPDSFFFKLKEPCFQQWIFTVVNPWKMGHATANWEGNVPYFQPLLWKMFTHQCDHGHWDFGITV